MKIQIAMNDGQYAENYQYSAEQRQILQIVKKPRSTQTHIEKWKAATEHIQNVTQGAMPFGAFALIGLGVTMILVQINGKIAQ